MLSLVPFLVNAAALVLQVGGGYYPTSDWAAMEVDVRDVGGHQVLSGLWSRSDWRHPGPLLYYLLAPFYHLSGQRSIGLLLGALAINAASVTAIALVARRQGGLRLLLLSLLGVALLTRTLGAGYISDPWVCFVVTLPFCLLLLLVWSLVCGHAWALPVAAVVATFLAQTHVSFLVLTYPLLGVGTVWFVVTRRRRALRPVGLAGGLCALLWLPLVIDVILNSPSNARRIVDYFSHPEAEPRGLGAGWSVVSSQFALVPEWLVRRDALTGFAEPGALAHPRAPVLLVVLAVVAIAVYRQPGWQTPRRLAAVLLASFVLGILAMARVIGPIFQYRMDWSWGLAMVTTVLLVWTALLATSHQWPALEHRVLVPLALVGLASVTAINSVTASRGIVHGAANGDNEIMAALAPDAVAALRALDGGPGVVEVADQWPNLAPPLYGRGLVLQLRRNGIEAVAPAGRYNLTSPIHFTDPADPPDHRVLVLVDRQVDRILADPRYRVLSMWTARPRDQYRQLIDQWDQFSARQAAGEIDEADDAAEAALRIDEQLRGNDRLDRYTVFAAAVVLETSAPD